MVTGNITWVCCGRFSTSNTLGVQQQSGGFSIKHIRVQSSNMGMSRDILHGWQEDFTTIWFHPVEGLNYSQYSARNCWTTVVGLPQKTWCLGLHVGLVAMKPWTCLFCSPQQASVIPTTANSGNINVVG